MKIVQEAIAGTLESSDLMVKISPDPEQLQVIIKSEVIKQFGDQIKAIVNHELSQLGVTTGLIVIQDKGALDCVIRARVQSAVLRAAKSEALNWEVLL
ncbi:citrate lyase acyl carrier protein [Celerinatantimonas diazotrophica]|uniref:Citrate lyase acyl carrier protein n=1 Tax=Celerinatantimonas diazotrophica TaxID=412034 RepID=A0A4R1J7G1_9GAMM|nr:citrate lyase acyl carrier protein [Celerinatantimonas diazotrophica]TCK46405.1 citrate lyase subunit gamma (acyl carrier protein) [Celerinatantimonas diazotrophica]CAG9295219.1 Citrate lyase acyl carrier protein [Celerinatantimonas diazotrophica]